MREEPELTAKEDGVRRPSHAKSTWKPVSPRRHVHVSPSPSRAVDYAPPQHNIVWAPSTQATQHVRRGGFSSSFFAGMPDDTTLHATTRNQQLKLSEGERKREQWKKQLFRLEDFHNRMMGEILLVKKRESRLQRRSRRRRDQDARREQAIDESAIVIQAAVRGRLVRLELRRVGDMVSRAKHEALSERGFFMTAEGQAQAQAAAEAEAEAQLATDDSAQQAQAALEASAVKIQSAARGWNGKRRLVHVKEQAALLHRFFRRSLRRKHDKKLLGSAKHMQSLFRGFLVRQVLNDCASEDDEVGTAAKRNAPSKRGKGVKVIKAKGATPGSGKAKKTPGFQAGSRGRGRRVSAHIRDSQRMAAVNRAREARHSRKAAAADLQATFRNFKQKKKVKSKAASNIQKRVRSRQQERRRSATAIQSRFRQRRARELELQGKEEEKQTKPKTAEEDGDGEEHYSEDDDFDFSVT